MAGRPLPTSLKILKGTNNPSRDNKQEPRLATAMPPMPNDLSPLAAAKWPEFCEILFGMNVLTKADAQVIRALCESYAKWRSLHDEWIKLPRAGIMEEDNGRIKMHPVLSALEIAENAYGKLLSKCGLTPTDRAKLKVNELSGENEFEDL